MTKKLPAPFAATPRSPGRSHRALTAVRVAPRTSAPSGATEPPPPPSAAATATAATAATPATPATPGAGDVVDHELDPARAALPRRRHAREPRRSRVRSAVDDDAPVADRRVPGRGHRHAGGGARARDERDAHALRARRVAADTIVKAPPYDPLQMPARGDGRAAADARGRRERSADARLRGRGRAALPALLDVQPLSKSYRAAFITRFAMQPRRLTDPEANDPATTRWLQTMAGPRARRQTARVHAARRRHGRDHRRSRAENRDRRPGRSDGRCNHLARVVRRVGHGTEARRCRCMGRGSHGVRGVGGGATVAHSPRTRSRCRQASSTRAASTGASFDVNAEVNMGTTAITALIARSRPRCPRR